MNGDDRKLKAELLTKTFELCDKIDEDYKEITKKTDASLEETLKECKKCLDYIENKKTDLILLHNQIKEKTANSWSKVIGEIIKHESKILTLFTQIKKITSKICRECKIKLPNQPFIYQQNKLKQWTINNPFELENTFVAFCSENCFKQSIYYQENTNEQSNTHSREREREQNINSSQLTEQSENKQYILCQECTQEISPHQTYYYNSKKPNIKLCSQSCYLEYYGEYCLTCKPDQKYLDIYKLNETDPGGFCWNCYQEQLRKLAELEKEGKEIEERINKQEKERKEWEKAQNKAKSDNIDLDSEQNRTEQNRTEQNRTEQNRMPAGSTINSINHLFSQFLQKTQNTYGINSPLVQNLTKEQAETISLLEKSSEQEQKEYLSLISKLQPFLEKMPNLNQEEQTKFMNLGQELENLENKLKEKQLKSEEQSEGSFEKQKVLQKDNRNKLILGIGCGVLGLGLVGLVIYLVKRRKG